MPHHQAFIPLLNSVKEVLRGRRPLFNVLSLPAAGIESIKRDSLAFYYLLFLGVGRQGFIPRCLPIPNATLQEDEYGRLWDMVPCEELKPKPQTETKDGDCCVCLQEGVQSFVKTMCGHMVCAKCFAQMEPWKCPVCLRKKWLE